jgi:hypothetical protein
MEIRVPAQPRRLCLADGSCLVETQYSRDFDASPQIPGSEKKCGHAILAGTPESDLLAPNAGQFLGRLDLKIKR